MGGSRLLSALETRLVGVEQIYLASAADGRVKAARPPLLRCTVARVCFTLQIRPDRLDEYVRRHAAVWPDMLEALAETVTRAAPADG